jgi:fatty acid desaturase
MSTGNQSTHFDAGSNQEAGPASQSSEVYIPNISTAERRKRLAFGALTFVITLAILAALVATGVSRWWRLPLSFLFMGAASGFFQWRDKT